MTTHTQTLDRLLRTFRLASDGQLVPTRRQALRTAATALATAVSIRAAKPVSLDVGIVGAGLAGLSCAYELRKAGIRASVYEASSRAGGRCHSMGGSFAGPVMFPGQVVERGGELIDNLHKTMLGYAKEFRLALEDVTKPKHDTAYYFDGSRVPESAVVEEFRALVAAMRVDLRAISKQPRAEAHTPADAALDRVSLREYLETRGAGRIVTKAIEQAYVAEYGREIAEQSCLNFLLFIHADRRSKFTPFGVFSDERYHLVDGNEGIARGLAAGIPGQVSYGKRLVRARKTPAGRVELQFVDGVSTTHDAVVLTLPFTVLREIDLSGLALPAWKAQAISGLGYGDNGKTMVGLRNPYWRAAGASGASYSDLINLQTTWETNPSRAGANGAVLTDYSGGLRGKLLDGVPLATAVGAFLGDLDRVLPGAFFNANGLAFREHWPSNPLALGSYTCYLPGQFTTIAGNEGKAVGNVFFAGEHTDSFYNWQGFMEGALLSGLAAAKALTSKK